MRRDRILSTGEACRLLGISERTLERWVSLGLVKPVRAGNGKGNHHAYSLADIFRLALVRGLRRRGLTLRSCGCVLEWLNGKSIDDLQTDWQRGRVYLLAVGDRIGCPRLLTRGEVYENEHLDLIGAHLLGVPVAVINTQKVHAAVVRALENDTALPEPAEA